MRRKTHLVVALGFVLLLPRIALAGGSIFSLGVEPLVGIEQEQRTDPTAHTHGHLIYGARATLSIPFFGLEGEYLHSSDSETFSTLSTQDVENKFKGGFRATFNLTYFMTFSLRGGVEYATDAHSDIGTPTSTSTTTANTTTLLPYAGAGMKIWLNRRMAFTLEGVGVPTSFPNMSLNNYQFTFGLLVRFP